jgi:hypothetical protein
MSQHVDLDGHETTSGVKRRLAIFAMTICVLLSGTVGCGVQQGEENIQKAKQAKKQVEGVQHKLQKKVYEGQ